MNHFDVVIIGASASGLMCAIEAGKRGRSVLVLDHATKACKKILISGGGRCNFTNLAISSENYISANPHFCKSALSRFSQWDFIAMIEAYKIPYHERDHGQLFCNDSAKDIRDMLMTECQQAQVTIKLETSIERVTKADSAFSVATSQGNFECESLVIASGGLSIPKMGATSFGYRIAEQFGLRVRQPVAGLVPFTLHDSDKEKFAPLSGIAIDCIASTARKAFHENLLFTHRGLSGPAMLQISSYWNPGETLQINLLPELDMQEEMNRLKQQAAKQQVKTVLGHHLPKRLVSSLVDPKMLELPVSDLSALQIQQLADTIHNWQIKPNGTEGYRTAEVTVGGIDTDELSSKTMESKSVNGLYFVGEVVDVTGWLGGYNFQWAWASGWCAGQYV